MVFACYGIAAGPEKSQEQISIEAGERLMARLQQGGRVMLSGTRIDGAYHLRAAILCFRTHVDHIDEAVAAIRDALAELDG